MRAWCLVFLVGCHLGATPKAGLKVVLVDDQQNPVSRVDVTACGQASVSDATGEAVLVEMPTDESCELVVGCPPGPECAAPTKEQVLPPLEPGEVRVVRVPLLLDDAQRRNQEFFRANDDVDRAIRTFRANQGFWGKKR
ncbi:MAG: hypothetical protein EP330_01745 [Deltaproteobacteria bacterium]|nr:MAG: hypothetical protein EP330_01745 [Deltaproteobacteria bacterium]